MYGLNSSQAQLTSGVAWANPAATTNKQMPAKFQICELGCVSIFFLHVVEK